MRLLLIRHGETEHNVAGLLAGVTDSALTNHGVLQIQRLAKYLTIQRSLRFTNIYASDLQRAYLTAEELQKEQHVHLKHEGQILDVSRLPILREQDFGSLELVPWNSRRADDAIDSESQNGETTPFKPKETSEALKQRAEVFFDDYIEPLLAVEDRAPEDCVAVVSHGLFLGSLWRAILNRFETRKIFLSPEASLSARGKPLEYLPSWTNTGYLDLLIRPTENLKTAAAELQGAEILIQEAVVRLPFHTLYVEAVNAKDHLMKLKRTRGGVGSATYDPRQKNLDKFFKRPRLDQEDEGTP